MQIKNIFVEYLKSKLKLEEFYWCSGTHLTPKTFTTKPKRKEELELRIPIYQFNIFQFPNEVAAASEALQQQRCFMLRKLPAAEF